MARPTNTQIVTAPLDLEAAAAARLICEEQGCTCGDALKLEIVTLEGDDVPPEARGYGKASAVDITHRASCPLLARTRVN